jgi:hypothetical protein
LYVFVFLASWNSTFLRGRGIGSYVRTPKSFHLVVVRAYSSSAELLTIGKAKKNAGFAVTLAPLHTSASRVCERLAVATSRVERRLEIAVVNDSSGCHRTRSQRQAKCATLV